jgi:hypothetical protein
MTRRDPESGFALLLVYVMAAAIAIALYMSVPRFAFEAQREQEQTLIDRGEQYQRAIQLYFRKFKRYPARIEDLENTNNVRYLRKRYKDPLTGKEEWRLIHVGPGGIFIDSLTRKPQNDKDKKQAASTNTFITEGPAIGATTASNAQQGPGMRRRPSDAPNAGAQMPGQNEPGVPPGAGPNMQPNAAPEANQAAVPGAAPGAAPGTEGTPGAGGAPAEMAEAPEGAPSGDQVTPEAQALAQQGPPGAQAGQTGAGAIGIQIPPGIQPGMSPAQARIAGRSQHFTGQVPAGMPQIPGVQGQPETGYPPTGQSGGVQAGTGGGQVGAGFGSSAGSAGAPGNAVPVNVPVGGSPFGGNQQPGQMPGGAPGFGQNQQGMGQNPQGSGQNQPGFGQNQPGGQAQNQAAGMLMQMLTTPRQGGPGGGQMGMGAQITGGIAGVASKVERQSINIYNEHEKYNEWEFIHDFGKDRTAIGGVAMQNSGMNQQQQQGSRPVSSPLTTPH